MNDLYPALAETFPALDVAEQATVVTPRVGAIARRLFSQPLHVVQMSEDVRRVPCQAVPVWPVHENDPDVIEWGEGTEDPRVYKTVVLDGTTYTVCRLFCSMLSVFDYGNRLGTSSS